VLTDRSKEGSQSLIPFDEIVNTTRAILSIHHGGYNEWLTEYEWRRKFTYFFCDLQIELSL
jgi:hypothetical protein